MSHLALPKGYAEVTPLKLVVTHAASRAKFTAQGIMTVGDLLEVVPRTYVPFDEMTDFGQLHVGEVATFVARVESATSRRMQRRRGSMLTVRLTDGRGGIVTLTFFSARGHDRKLVPGAAGLFHGQVGEYHGTLQLTHPDYTVFGDDEEDGGLTVWRGCLLPVYVESGALTNKLIRRYMAQVVNDTEVDEPVPERLWRRHDGGSLVSHAEAIDRIQRPRTWAEAEGARRRLRYDEALTLQVIIAQRRRLAAQTSTTIRTPRAEGILAAFDSRLPFELTTGQREVGEQILADLTSSQPMHRLLQGEVGSGKTLVALRAMLAMVDAGGQAALLAPTEVLAAQHFRSITAMLGDLADAGYLGGSDVGTRVALLTGGQPAAQRRRALAQVASGEAGIVVGTHALIQSHVMFSDLALVVVDEQHRFGVEQRDALRDKGISPPHVLVMTATPIPRTVAMTVFGDLETSTLRELPRGRAPISTHVADETRPGWFDRIWARVAEEVRGGHQAFVVCPKIGDLDEAVPRHVVDEGASGEEDPPAEAVDGSETDTMPMRGVLEMAQLLAGRAELAGTRIGVLHGRLDSEVKDEVMTRFADGEIDVLVATTVIEVGVDVPNATMMVIVDADRFGISQLHQLRGRVGRGVAAGTCLLTTRLPEQAAARERLAGVAATTDGFALAQLDLQQRREGDILGARQSGFSSSLRFLRITHPDDEQIIDWARQDAALIIEDDPDLCQPQHQALAGRVRTRLDAEQAAYLERG